MSMRDSRCAGWRQRDVNEETRPHAHVAARPQVSEVRTREGGDALLMAHVLPNGEHDR